MKKNQISVLATTKRLLYHYCSKVLESPNFVSEQTNDLAYAIIYLVNRYDEEFQRENWEELYDDFGELFDEIECDSFDVDIHKAPLWCSWSVITNDFYGVDKVLYYALRV
ncbi:MAG: hypothetical protein PHW20_06770, partial [Clostridia bacterium]|nr:hypothetical protein [Clostridia bacterium]